MQPSRAEEATMEHRWKVLTVVSVATFMASLDLFIVNIAFPDMRADFAGSSVAALSWVLNAYAIVFAALLVPAGRFADRVGRRRAFLGGLGLFLAGSALCGVAPSVATLVAARVLQAAGAALILPTSLALLLPEFPPLERTAAIGIWAAAGGVSAAFGPPLGGLLVEASWRLVFLVNLPIGVVAAAYAARVLRESRDADADPRLPDLLGTAILAGAVGLLALGLVKAPDWSWGDARTLASLAAAAAGLGWFWARCASHPAPVVDLAMLRVRSFALANAAMLVFGAGFAAMLLGTVLFLTGVWGDSVLRAGLSISPGPIMAATFAATSARLADRIGQRTLASLGCLLFGAAAAWWLWRLDATPAYAADFLPAMIVGGTGVGLVLPSLSSAAAASLPPARFATGSAVLTMSRQIGTVLGIAIVVAVLGAPGGGDTAAAFDGCWILMVVAALLGAAAGWAIGPVQSDAATTTGSRTVSGGSSAWSSGPIDTA
jgi:EmrB/QacA subfamily drug resistance transporter